MSSSSRVIDRNLAVAIAVVVALAVTTLVVVIAKNAGQSNAGSTGVPSSVASSFPSSTAVTSAGSSSSSTRSPGPSISGGAGDSKDGKGAFVGDVAGAPPGWRRILDSETDISYDVPTSWTGPVLLEIASGDPKAFSLRAGSYLAGCDSQYATALVGFKPGTGTDPGQVAKEVVAYGNLTWTAELTSTSGPASVVTKTSTVGGATIYTATAVSTASKPDPCQTTSATITGAAITSKQTGGLMFLLFSVADNGVDGPVALKKDWVGQILNSIRTSAT